MWRHLAPTAPDQLHCYPFIDQDPFIISECPHVYFIGNQDQFQTKIAEGSNGQTVRLIALPNFATTQTAILLNLSTLEVHPLSFNTNI